MTKHLEELEEIARLRLGIIGLIRELDKPQNKDLEIIKDFLKDLVEGVEIQNTEEERKIQMKEFLNKYEEIK